MEDRQAVARPPVPGPPPGARTLSYALGDRLPATQRELLESARRGLPREVVVANRTDCRLALKAVRLVLARLDRNLASYPAAALPAVTEAARALTAAIRAALGEAEGS